MSEFHQRQMNEFTKKRIIRTEEKVLKLPLQESTETINMPLNEGSSQHQESIEKFYKKILK